MKNQESSDKKLKTGGMSDVVKTTLITVIGSIAVAIVTTLGTIAVNGKGIKNNAEQLDALDRKAEFLKKPSLPVGTIVASVLTPAEFAKAADDPNNLDVAKSKWTLADGKTVSGTDYVSVRGVETVPDLRGVFLRGKNFGKRANVEEVELGLYHDDTVGPHQHRIMVNNDNPQAIRDTGPGIVYATGHHTDGPDRLVAAWPAPETQPKNVTVNYYMRINN